MAVGHDIIVVGASAGGMQVVVEILRGLPRDLPAAVFVVIHTAPTSPGVLPQILDRAGSLGVTHAEDGEAIRRGRVYVAPPDHHMLLKGRKARPPRDRGEAAKAGRSSARGARDNSTVPVRGAGK